MSNEKNHKSPCTVMANDKGTRKFRQIDKKDILYIEKYNILPISTDEVFVRIKHNYIHYISNYGRCISITDKARFLTGGINTNDKLFYQFQIGLIMKRYGEVL